MGASPLEGAVEWARGRQEPEGEGPGIGAALSGTPGLPVERSRYSMGTEARVRIEAIHEEVGGASGVDPVALAEGALERIDEVDRAASLYRPESDLCRVNAAAASGRSPVGPLLAELLAESMRLARLTRGAFDPTIKPLMDELGFYREIGSRPDSSGMKGALARVGWRKIALDRRKGEIRFRRPGMALDFGGIGKGYALDRGGEFLKMHGVVRAQIELGRSYLFIGKDPEEGSGRFSLGVAVPGVGGTEEILALIFAPEGAVATSSPLTQTRRSGSRIVGHIVDPHSGPLTTAIRSVTVWARRGAEADALATALVVAGPGGIERLRRKLPFEALVVLEGDEPAIGRAAGGHRAPGGVGGPALGTIIATPGLAWTASPKSGG